MAWNSDIGRYAASVPARATRARDRLGQTGQKVARARARVRTGEMRNRIEYQSRINTLESAAPWTRFHEFGTRYIDAQPMLTPAFDVMADQVGDEYERAFK